MEIKVIEQELSKSQLSSSNLEIAVKKGITISKKASQLWVSSDYSDKQRLQYLIYPDGILYNKENNTVRTPRVNSLFTAISYLSYISAENKNGQPMQIDQDFNSWSCRESNPGPNIFAISFLHVYLCIVCRGRAGA